MVPRRYAANPIVRRKRDDVRALLDANRFRRLTLDNAGPARKS
jgi:hypothetical protein